MEYFNARKMLMNLWWNTTGETREIYTSPPTKHDFYWRASITSIAIGRRFSLFPGMEGIVMLLEGGKMLPESAGRFNHTLEPLQPFPFAADLVVKVRLTIGQMSMDFSTMTCLDVCEAKVGIVERMFATFGPCDGMVFIISGVWQLGDKLFTADQGTCWLDSRYTLWLLQPQDKLLFNEISQLAGHSPDQVQ